MNDTLLKHIKIIGYFVIFLIGIVLGYILKINGE